MTTKRDNQEEKPTKNSGLEYRFLLLVGALMGLIYLLMPILSPFIVALVLAYIGHPLVDRLHQLKLGSYHLGRGTAAFFVISLMTATVLLVIFMITAPTLYQNALKVQLPNAQTGEAQAKQTLEIVMQFLKLFLTIKIHLM